MKVKRFRISFEIFKQMFGQGKSTRAFTVIDGGLPEDAQLVAVNLVSPEIVELAVSSESFPVSSAETTGDYLTVTLRSN